MEKIKQFQPVIIVILICLLLFQFVQINNMSKQIADLQYQTSELESKIDKISGNDFEYEIDKIKDRLSNVEGNFDDLEKNLKSVDANVSLVQITVNEHDDFIKELKDERLFRSFSRY